jgi:hypothetical protein
MVIVVSEVTGRISLALEGKLNYDLSEEELKKMLQEAAVMAKFLCIAA